MSDIGAEGYQLGFKVVRVGKTGKLYSANRLRPCGGARKGLTVIYGKGQWARPKLKHGPLAVFITEFEAAVFMREQCVRTGHGPQFKLFWCVYQRSTEESLYFPTPGHSQPRWETLKHWLPRGTDFATKVMLIEEVN